MLRNLRSLSGLRTLRSPLTSEAPTNVELSGGAATLGIEESGVPKPEIKIIRKRGQEYALGFGLLWHSHLWAAEALTSVGSRGTHISGQPSSVAVAITRE